MPDVHGRCPACGGSSLFLGEGGHVTCSRIDCPDPSAGDGLLCSDGVAIARVRALHRPANYRGLLICAACSGFDGSTCDNSPCGYQHCPTLKALGETPARLLNCGLCYEEQGEECHPHPECTMRAPGRTQPPVVGTAHIALDVQPPTADEVLNSLREHAADVRRRTGLDVTVEPFNDRYAVTVDRPDGRTRRGGYGAAEVDAMLLGVDAASPRLGVRPHVVAIRGATSSTSADLPGSPTVFAGGDGARLCVDGREMAVSSEHAVVVDRFDEASSWRLLTLTLVAARITIDGKEVGDDAR
jgi:hypothetical protein